MAHAQTSVVIVNWNGAAFLPRLLASLEPHRIARIVVVDNHSTDNSLEVLWKYSQVQVIVNEQNEGYGRAANQGFKVCDTPYVLLLNVDMVLLPGCVALLEERLIRDSGVAVVAPQLLFPNENLQPSLRKFPTARTICLYLSFLDRIVPSGYRLPARNHQQSSEVDQPMGAALLIRKSVWEQLNGFDPQFFLYMEEVDFCYRVKKAGYKILYVPEAKMIHHAGGSSRQAWGRSQQHLLDSTFLYFEKHSPAEARKLRFVLPPALLLRALVLLFAGRFHQSWFFLRKAFTL